MLQIRRFEFETFHLKLGESGENFIKQFLG